MTPFYMFFPLNSRKPASQKLHVAPQDIASLVSENIPAFTSAHIVSKLRMKSNSPYIIMKASLPKSSSKKIYLNLRMSFCKTESAKHYWRINVDLIISRVDNTIQVKRPHHTGKPHLVDEATFTRQIKALYDILEALFSPHGGASSLIPADICTGDRSATVFDVMAKIGDQGRLFDKHEETQDKIMRQRRATEMSKLPDGAPLIIRDGSSGRTWSLGVKRGKVSQATAHHARIASPEEVESDLLSNAGLSRHRSLPMSILAKQACEMAPHLKIYPAHNNQHERQTLSELEPFHDSLTNNQETKERRKAMPKIWCQTGNPHNPVTYEQKTEERGAFYIPQSTNGPHSDFSFYEGDEKYLRITALREVDGFFSGDDLLDLDIQSNRWTVSEKLAAILENHNIGDSTLSKFNLYSPLGEKREDRYFLLMKESRNSIIEEYTNKVLLKSFRDRGAKDFEIAADKSAHGGLDLWFDLQLNQRRPPLLVSHKLRLAMQRAKIRTPLVLKRCDVF